MQLLRSHPVGAILFAVALFAFATTNLIRFYLLPASPEVYTGYYQKVAEQVLHACVDLPEEGSVVLLVHEGEYESANKTQMNRMFKSLEKSGLSIAHVDILTVDEGENWSSTGTGFPYDEFLRVAGEYPDAAAIISLCGFPLLSKGQAPSDPHPLPALLVTRVDEGMSRKMSRHLASGVVQVAVVPREGRSSEAEPPPSLFDREYVVIHGTEL